MTLGSENDKPLLALGIWPAEVKDFGGMYLLVDQQATYVGIAVLAMLDIDYLKERLKRGKHFLERCI